MVMENTLRVEDLKNLQSLFDIKGSTVDRYSKPDADTLKDVNWLRLGKKFHFEN